MEGAPGRAGGFLEVVVGLWGWRVPSLKHQNPNSRHLQNGPFCPGEADLFIFGHRER